MDYKDLFLHILRIISPELDKTENAFLEIGGLGLFCADLLAPFCDINWDQRGIKQGHIKPNYSAVQGCHYLPMKHMRTLRRTAFIVMRNKMAKLKGDYLRAEGNRHTNNFRNTRDKLTSLCCHHIITFSSPWPINLTGFIS